MERKQIEALAEALFEPFRDGFQISDLITLTVSGMRAVEQWQGMNAAKKKHALIEALKIVVDKTDTPWLPDSLTDPLIKMFIPTLVDTLAKASKGLLGFNSAEAERSKAERERAIKEISDRKGLAEAGKGAEVLDKISKDLDERENSLDERFEALNGLEEVLNERESLLEAREVLIDQRESDLMKLREALENSQGEESEDSQDEAAGE